MKKPKKQVKSVQKPSPETETPPTSGAASPQWNVFFLQDEGVEPFTKWFNELRDRVARQRIAARLRTVGTGSLGNTEPVGEGVSEFKIDYGPGYRIYYGRKGSTFVVILCGGDKTTQAADIKRAQDLWKKHKDEIENA